MAVDADRSPAAWPRALRTVPLALLLTVVMPLAAQPSQRTPGDTLSPETRRAIDRFATGAMDDLGLVPGLALAVVVDDAVVYERGFGQADVEAGSPVTPHTVFYTASLGKSFTGMTAAVLAARGELELDAPLRRFFPGLTTEPPVDAGRVTVRDLLRHAKGFTNGAVNYVTTYVGPMPDDELTRVLNGYSDAAEGFVYSNTNYALAGYVVERAAGVSWRDAMDAAVFRPLGMDRSTAYRSRVDDDALARPYLARADGVRRVKFMKTDATITGAGGIFSSAHDLARYVVANLNAGRLDGRQALPAEAVRMAHAPQVELEREFFEFERFAYGLGFYRARWGDELLVHHFGGYPGYRSHLSFMPQRRLGVVVLQNEGIDGSRLADIVAAYVYDTLLGRTDADARGRRRLEALREAAEERRAGRAEREARLARLEREPAAPALPPADYAGYYRNHRLGTLEVVADGDRLRVEWGDLYGPALPVGGNEFVVPWIPGGTPVRFVFGTEDGAVTGFDWGGRPFVRVERAAERQERG